MTDLPKSAQVVVIGGGVMGASTAYHLALKGCRDVLLLEREPYFGTGATGRCAGGIRYQFSTEINIRLSQISLPMLERFEEETGQAIDLRHCGYLFLLTNERDLKRFRANVELQRGLGVASEWLSGEEVRRRAPLLAADDVVAGTFHGKDGLADPHGVVSGYIAGARRMGVTALTSCAVIDLDIRSRRVVAVRTDRGSVDCPVVVNAAGAWSPEVSSWAGLSLPVTPVRRQMLTTARLESVPDDMPFIIDFAQGLYFHREGDGILTGMSNPNQAPGFDQSVDEQWELVHMEAAVKRMPLLATARRQSAWAGLYQVTPDAHPILGPAPGLEGFFAVTGFSGHGFMHGPVSGLLMAEIILDGWATTLDVSILNWERFDKGGFIREYNVI